jgi:hypothetical protein
MKAEANVILVDNRPFKSVAGTKVGHNGYVVLELDNHQLQVEYYDEKNLLLTEWWEYNKGTQTLMGKSIKNDCSELSLVQALAKAIE